MINCFSMHLAAVRTPCLQELGSAAVKLPEWLPALLLLLLPATNRS